MRAIVLAVIFVSILTGCTDLAPPEHPAATTQATLLFNGWKISPAGAHAQIGDMPLKMVLSPDGKTLAAVCGGFRTGLALIDVQSRQVRQFLALQRCWNGVAFSPDGKRIYVSGGNSDELFVFDHETATRQASVKR